MWWYDAARFRQRMLVNRTLEVAVSEREIRSEPEYRELILRRLAQAVWLTMPTHDVAST